MDIAPWLCETGSKRNLRGEGTVNRRRAALTLAAVATLLVGGATLAWACTSQASITISPRSGAPGSGVTVNGQDFTPGSVEIRWNSRTGPVLGYTTGASFSTRVTIPADASPRTHVIIACAPACDADDVAGTGSAAFTVVTSEGTSSDQGGETSQDSAGTTSGSESQETSGSGSGTISGSSSDGSQSDTSESESTGSSGSSTEESSTSESTDAAASSQTSTQQDSATATEQEAASSTATEPQPAADDQQQAAATEPAGDEQAQSALSAGQDASQPAGTSDSQPPTSQADQTEPATSGEQESPTAQGQPAVQARPDPAPPAVDEPARVPHRAAAADLWSGFAAEDTSSLSPGLTDTSARPGADPAMPAGALALLATGLLGLFAGTGVAAARRRKVGKAQGTAP